MASKEKTEVAAPANTAIAVGAWDQFAGQGQEGTDAGDYAIPYLTILQKLSPAIDEIEGAKAGMIMETATNMLFNGEREGLSVVPCYFRKDLVEWKPRESGGGLVKAHGWDIALLEKTTRNERGQQVLPNGNILSDTKYHYVLVLAPGGTIQAVISMTSTQLKKSRKWMSMMNMRKMSRADGTKFTPPSFAYEYVLGTVHEENEKGKWDGWTIAQGPELTDRNLIKEAIQFHRAIARGEVKMSDPDAERKSDMAADEDIPF